jgi:flavin-dependent dehydrogenase
MQINKKKILIIGAGVSGLSAGIYALKNGFDAEIYEKGYVSFNCSCSSLYSYKLQ